MDATVRCRSSVPPGIQYDHVGFRFDLLGGSMGTPVGEREEDLVGILLGGQ